MQALFSSQVLIESPRILRETDTQRLDLKQCPFLEAWVLDAVAPLEDFSASCDTRTPESVYYVTIKLSVPRGDFLMPRVIIEVCG